jgi:hypothetical protein
MRRKTSFVNIYTRCLWATGGKSNYNKTVSNRRSRPIWQNKSLEQVELISEVLSLSDY